MARKKESEISFTEKISNMSEEELDRDGISHDIEELAHEISDDIKNMSDDELLAELIGDQDSKNESSEDITVLRHVRPAAERRAAQKRRPDWVARREPCPNFQDYKPIFKEIHDDLRSKRRVIGRSARTAQIKRGSLHIVGGQMAFITEIGAWFRPTPNAPRDARIHVVFDNGTQSNMLIRSFSRALNKDPLSRTISDIIKIEPRAEEEITFPDY